MLQLRIVPRGSHGDSFARQRRSLSRELVTCRAERIAVHAAPDHGEAGQHDARAHDNGAALARGHRAPPHWPGPRVAAEFEAGVVVPRTGGFVRTRAAIVK